jgi:hypothetical protein
MIPKVIVAFGVWLLSDAIYSWVLYLNSQSWRGPRQDFIHDNWVRLVRGLIGIALIAIGFIGFVEVVWQ